MGNLDENTMMLITSWGPPLISILVGGFLANWLFPKWQNRAAEAKSFNDRRFALMEEIADSFPAYVNSWRRLIQISMHEESNGLSEAETERKISFVTQRNAARDGLYSALSRGRVYFSTETWGMISSFKTWDSMQGDKRLADLPEIEEWLEWEDRIMDHLTSREFSGRR